MENIVSYALPVLLCFIAIRLLYVPARWILRVFAHAGCGLICLWLLNTASGVTGVALPINAVTVLLCGTLGIPGTALVVLMEMINLLHLK